MLPLINEYSPYALVKPGGPPIYLYYKSPPALGQAQTDPTHTANFGVKLQEKCRAVGVACELAYPGASEVTHPDVQSTLVTMLKRAP